jgi:hypothetical protein
MQSVEDFSFAPTRFLYRNDKNLQKYNLLILPHLLQQQRIVAIIG